MLKYADVSNPLSSLKRFASRSRLFSRETSLSTTDDGSERGSTRSRVLRTQQTMHASSPGQYSTTSATFTIPEPGSHTLNFKKNNYTLLSLSSTSFFI